jgi:superfamily I DNA and/or RNA helicase
MSPMAVSEDALPSETGALAAWFAEGVRSEVEALEKGGGVQKYEVLSGKLIENTGTNQAIYRFIVADGTHLPEDASGRLQAGREEYAASVISQQANTIHIYVTGADELPLSMPRALLSVDDTALLRKLAEVLEGVGKNPERFGSLATTVFHPARAEVDFADLSKVSGISTVEGRHRRVLEQACGSSLTYVWGPPGTGKTFGIARLITSLIEAGERVLVTSHTHAAVDQALYELVMSESDKVGPLATHPFVKEGKVLRIGLTPEKKIPDEVRLDKVIEVMSHGLGARILELEAEVSPLNRTRASLRKVAAEWQKLVGFKENLKKAERELARLKEEEQTAKDKVERANNSIGARQDELDKAEHAWFRRARKVERAQTALEEAKKKSSEAEKELSRVEQNVNISRRSMSDLKIKVGEQGLVCKVLPPIEEVETELGKISSKIERLESEIRDLQNKLSQLEQELINNARVIFCTLTKSYTGKELVNQKFDAVIVDEISMALPPLIFVAAGRATKRVVLVGDFLQLPPIVRGDTTIGDKRLGTDIFHLAKIAIDGKPAYDLAALTWLDTQQRMLPAIAEVARHMVYRRAGPDYKDHEKVMKRPVPEWLNYLPENPLVIVDTADLHCWSGKQAGGLSRFNFYSATVAVEIAAMAAARIPKPAEDAAKPIGIVTPYSAQRRLLSKLIESLGLEPWVVAGTVHTFQGGQAEVVIFDSVLDDPYWSARLCMPRFSSDVKRDLNVAVTRARSKFVFVGSSDWLNRHSNPASGLGDMWACLIRGADLISAVEIVGPDFMKKVADGVTVTTGWTPMKGEEYMLEHLDEETFFSRFAGDINGATASIFALAPYFGSYRWPRVQPFLAASLARGIEVTIVTPPLSEAENPEYVQEVVKNLRALGAVVITASGLHGKDVIIDERIVYAGSMNWSSNRGRLEEIHRMNAPAYAKICLELMQARYVRRAAVQMDGSPRKCPYCRHQVQIVNQRKQSGAWDRYQAMKIGCTNLRCRGYLRDVNERLPFKERPLCRTDGRTQYRRVRSGRGEAWQCPKHPRECRIEKVVPGDLD